jgi:hypothetical protein
MCVHLSYFPFARTLFMDLDTVLLKAEALPWLFEELDKWDIMASFEGRI